MYSIMLCVRHIRNTGLPMSWGDVCCSICLTRAVTHDPSTGVRATTSLRGERAQQAAYSLPSHRFSLALSFPQPTPLLWGTIRLNSFHDFSRQILSLSVLCSIMEVCSFGCCIEGDGEGGKRGTGGENPEGEGDCSRAAPLPLGCLPKTAVKRSCVSGARRKNKTTCKENGH